MRVHFYHFVSINQLNLHKSDITLMLQESGQYVTSEMNEQRYT